MKLTVQNAEIKTATVEVKTLTISGKQVTLAVFRQLQDDALVSDSGTLNGVPWGTVNYHPDKCGTAPDHLHVVWQNGSELKRARVDPPGFRSFVEDDDLPGTFAQAAFCVNDHVRPAWARQARADDAYCWKFDFDQITCETFDTPDYPGSKHVCMTRDDLVAVERELREAVTQEKLRRQRHRDQWKVLNDLPQLFIAV